MAASQRGASRAVRLTEEIIRCGELAYNPELPIQTRDANETQFKDLLSRTKIMALIPVLTSLVQPGRVQPWLRPHLVHALALLPLRPRGVRHTIEFILSVHPSTAHKASLAPPSTAESRGPGISLEGLSAASRLISSPPSSLSPDEWFSAIAPQLLSLLDGEGGLEMVKAASFVIGYGILGRKALGAPGTPGWKSLAEPILLHIDPTLSSGESLEEEETGRAETAITLVKPRNIIVTAPQVAEALRRLVSLISSHPNPGLSKRLLDRLLLPLWLLFSWSASDTAEVEEQWRAPARFLLQILLQLSSDGTQLMLIAQNLLYQGNRDDNRLCWTYKPASGGGIQVEKWSGHDDRTFSFDEPLVTILDKKVDAFIELIKPWKDNDDVPALFLSLCRRWLLTRNEPGHSHMFLASNDTRDSSSLESRIVDAKVMQKLMDSLPERLISDSTQILELVSEVLVKIVGSGEDLDTDDTVAVALSLLNMVFAAKSSGKASKNQLADKSIRHSLEVIAARTELEASTTARNLLLLLEFQATEPALLGTSADVLDKNLEDRRTYSLALSYMTGADSPPPVRAQGLDLLSSLVAAGSSILDIPATLIVLSSTLQDDEEYIYLRVIKVFILLSIKHPKAVMLGLLERYIDANEEIVLDSRLRLGEALLQVVQKAGQTFTGDLARQVGEGLLTIAGRRGYRPKHEAEQQKKAELSKRKNQEAEEAWDGPVPRLEDAPDTMVEDEILSQIVSGWEGQRGEEDVRIRASALSIFGSAIETNIAGLGPLTTSTAVDLSINILALEPEPEKAILRRAAAFVVMSVVRTLDIAQEKGKKLGFGLAGQSLEDVLRILRYVAETDNDGLVRQHAKDVIEGLGTWQMKDLLALRDDARTELEKLAGLSIDSRAGSTRIQRPKIEEIE